MGNKPINVKAVSERLARIKRAILQLEVEVERIIVEAENLIHFPSSTNPKKD